MELKNKKINFLGDSITEGCGTSHEDNCFASILGRRLALAAARNYGIGGTRIARQQDPSLDPRHDLYFGGRIGDMDPDADVVVVFGGTNDYGHGDAPLGTPEDRTPDTYWGACHTLFTGLRERYPAAKLVVLTPLHRLGEDDPRGDSSKAVPSAPLCEYVRILKVVAQAYRLPVLDLFETSLLDTRVEGIVEKYVPDGLHPNDAGHLVLADEIGAFLKNL